MFNPIISLIFFTAKVALVAIGALFLLMLASASAHGQYSSTANFLDSHILEPRGSVIEGDHLVANWRWYGIPVRSQLAVLGAETSLGTYPEGGRLVYANNFGCVKAFNGYQSTPYGEWASGTIRVGGKTWLRYPTVAKGVHGWGRFMKVAANGAYADMVFNATPNWKRFASTYYGRGVPGLYSYINNLRAIDRQYTAMARKHGFEW